MPPPPPSMYKASYDPAYACCNEKFIKLDLIVFLLKCITSNFINNSKGMSDLQIRYFVKHEVEQCQSINILSLLLNLPP